MLSISEFRMYVTGPLSYSWVKWGIEEGVASSAKVETGVVRTGSQRPVESPLECLHEW